MNRNEVKEFATLMKKEFPIYQNVDNLCYLDSAATSLKPK